MRINIIIFATLSIGLNCILPSEPNDSRQQAILPLLAPQPEAPVLDAEPETLLPRVRFYNGMELKYSFGLCVNYKCKQPITQDVLYPLVPEYTYSDYESLAVFYGYVSVFGARENIPRIEFPGSKTETVHYTCTVTIGGIEYTVVCEKD